jgi:P2-related tail formation protein
MAGKLDNLLVYIISSVSSQVLPYLAAQFDISDDPMYINAVTDDQKRLAIQQAIQLKRYVGTVYAIEQAITAVGIEGATLVEGINTGNPQTDWACFSVTVPLQDGQGLDVDASQSLINLIERYKNVRSWLIGGVTYLLSLTDNIHSSAFTDSVIINEGTNGYSDSLSYSPFYYNGKYTYNGTQVYSDPIDSLVINITQS